MTATVDKAADILRTERNATVLNITALQAVPAALLNRDNYNAQKIATYGNTVRARVSSQSWKRAIRLLMRKTAIDGGVYASRSNKWPRRVREILVDTHGVDELVAGEKANNLFRSLGIKVNDNGQTNVQVYAGDDAGERLAKLIVDNFDAIGDFEEIDRTVVAKAREALDVNTAIDLALFGRMLADSTSSKININAAIDGAASVGHALSVDAAAITDDFYTAVDDFATNEDPAVSSNLGVTDLSSQVFHRTASIDIEQLKRNLSSAPDADKLVSDAVENFLRSFVAAVPSAKQHSTNVGTLPSLVIVTVSGSRRTYDNAFVNPIRDENVVGTATRKLLRQIDFAASGGAQDEVFVLPLSEDSAAEVDGAKGSITEVQSLDELIAKVIK